MDAALLLRLQTAVAEGPALRFVIVFGSRARGQARPDSDLDVAVHPTAPLSRAQHEALLSTLERAAGTNVDLVYVDQAPAALRWRIARDGVVVSSDPPYAAKRFMAQVGIEHDENRDLQIDAMRRYRAALASSRPEGPQ